LIEFFYEKKNWLCWDIGPALVSKVTLFSVSKVFCGPEIWTPLRGRRLKKGSQFFEKKSATLAASVAPNVKSWLRACPDMTYNVFVETLNLAQSISDCRCMLFLQWLSFFM